MVDLSDEELDLHLNVNLRATILLTRELLRGMLEQGEGVIINISSQAGTWFSWHGRSKII